MIGTFESALRLLIQRALVIQGLPTPEGAELTGMDSGLSESERGMREGNCNNATAIVFGQVVRFGYFVKEADIIPAWERYLNANRKMMGLE